MPRPPQPPLHPDGRPAGAEGGDRRQDGPRLGLRDHPEAGARHQRRQACRLQRLCDPARPRRRGAPPGPVLDHLSRGDPPRRRCDRRGADGLRERIQGDARTARTGGHGADQAARVRLAVEPHRRGVQPRADRGDRSSRRSSGAGGCSPTRSTSTSSTAATPSTRCRSSCPSWRSAASSPTAWRRPMP